MVIFMNIYGDFGYWVHWKQKSESLGIYKDGKTVDYFLLSPKYSNQHLNLFGF